MYPMADPVNSYDNNNYDVFPLVVVKDRETVIHIRPQGGRPDFEPGKEYEVEFCALDGGKPYDFPATGDFRRAKAVCNAEGGFDIPHTFDKEQEYFLRLLEGDRCKQRFSVYCVNEDLCGRYPFIGDLHMHTTGSDGNQEPEVVMANYRKYGYDFSVVSDHCVYYPSLRALHFYEDLPLEFTIIPGEECHLPPVYGQENDVHIVNFGGEYSINALTQGEQWEQVGTDPQYRSLYGQCPPVMSYEEYQAEMQKRADAVKPQLPETVDAVPYAVCCWIFDEIRKANGLGIFAHPNWKRDAYHVPEAFTDYMMETHPFDAFEVLGGESYYEQNGFQTVRYYEEKAKGHIFPIVGSTDSHSSYPSNRNAFICETIVFSPENERRALIASIKDFYSVAVDTIDEHFRLVGDSRLVRYGCFLLKHFFPRHDELSFEEGRLMKQYAKGTPEEKADAVKILSAITGRMKKQREKYFDF